MPEFWKEASGIVNPELICLRELLEFKSDWHYTILKGRHNLPLLSRIDLERHIVERSGHISSLNDSFLSAESFSS